jgi:hypothetical protein
MNRSDEQRGSQLQPEGIAHSPSDLAERFHEWQRRRKQFRDLARLASNNSQSIEPCDSKNEKRGK